LQFTTIKQQLGPKLNGILDYDWWIPSPKMQFPGIMDFLEKYQAKAPGEKVDPLGWYLPPFAYANLQVLGDAVEGAKSLDQTKLADYIRSHSFNTIVGEISFGKDGEWSAARPEVGSQDIQGTDLDSSGYQDRVIWSPRRSNGRDRRPIQRQEDVRAVAEGG
jgi:branched-chain amino acid transport system substrate-binding protein